ncbi:MAG: transposase [Candidatus Marinimicrobia bacterium]|nr:transposase [Candidatus Neomarinimicrobiota bacterium]
MIPSTENGAFVAAMEQVLDVYRRPYNVRYPVVNMDESTKQLIGETKIPLPMKSGQAAKYDCEYIRRGVCNIFMANEALRGRRFVKITERKTKIDWAIFMKAISDDYYKEAERITICAVTKWHLNRGPIRLLRYIDIIG